MKLLFLVILIVVFSFSQKAFAGDLQGFMNAMEKAKDAGFTLDPNATAKEYGYKNFKGFAKEYLVAHDIDPKDISVEEVKEFLLGTDRTIEIVQSQENLDKLHSLIVNDKYFRKRTSYFKKKHEKRTKLLVVYINSSLSQRFSHSVKINSFRGTSTWSGTSFFRTLYCVSQLTS